MKRHDTLSAMLNTDYWEGLQESIHSDMPFSNPERYERIIEGTCDGCDGSTHAERLEDMRDCVSSLNELDLEFEIDPDDEEDKARLIDLLSMSPEEHIEKGQILGGALAFLEREIDEVEAWHEENGTLHEEVG